ncbi:MAG: aminodeoxychorismate/anthranilate synthase component II [Nonlabens sp.]
MIKKILVIDNYDSFTYNLVHYLEDLNVEVMVKRNDSFELEEGLDYDAVLLSPGPGIPSEAGKLLPMIHFLAGKKPMLGICLGHQAITEVYGGKIINIDKVYHGVATEMTHNNDPLFKNVDVKFEAGRYHSWVSEPESFPEILEIIATDENKQIMALKHRNLPIYGIQFHPESVMTPQGKQMLQNFLDLI